MKKRPRKQADRTVPEKVSRTHKMFHRIFGLLQQIVNLLSLLIERLDTLIMLQTSSIPVSKYDDVVKLVKKVRYDNALDIQSIPKAVQYIRFNVDEDSRYYDQCIKARECVKDRAKKCANGEEKAWHSIAKMSQPKYGKSSRRSRNPAPGPVPIPDASWALGISPPGGMYPGNYFFPR